VFFFFIGIQIYLNFLSECTSYLKEQREQETKVSIFHSQVIFTIFSISRSQVARFVGRNELSLTKEALLSILYTYMYILNVFLPSELKSK